MAIHPLRTPLAVLAFAVTLLLPHSRLAADDKR